MNHYLQLTLVALLALVSTQVLSNSTVESWYSSALHANDSQWYKPQWQESDIPLKLSKQAALHWYKQANDSQQKIKIDSEIHYQTVLGLGSSLEHASVYAIRKNKNEAQQRQVLKALIDPNTGIGLNLFRISIGTSDFSDGTLATPPASHPNGWYSLQDNADGAFSIERNRSLGIIATLKMAIEVGEKNQNPLKFVATPWSPPAWMRENNTMVKGGALKTDMMDNYVRYLRQFVESYQAEGIPIYAITMQNERQFEPETYPGLIMSWQQERDLLIKVYENFHNIGGKFGAEIKVKLWSLDHNFNYWQQAAAQISSLQKMAKDHYLDATAFHHYDGDSAQMALLHESHPDKDVIFTEGSVWGIGGDNANRGFQSVIRHFRHWSTAYISWVTMLTQRPDEANQSPYNQLGKVGPTLLIQQKGNSSQWYKIPEYWLLGQFSRFIKRGAKRIYSNEGSIATLSNVAFQNPDNSIIVVVANSREHEQTLNIEYNQQYIHTRIPGNSLATFRWHTEIAKQD